MSHHFTVFGSGGYVGSNLLLYLRRAGHEVQGITRETWPVDGAKLGHVIFTIGMTADFRGKPLETFDTQVIRLHEVLSRYRFSSLLYVSSTRIYYGADDAFERSNILICPSDPDQTYNIAKLAGESLCLGIDRPTIRVVRLSNVFGGINQSPSFLRSILNEAALSGHVRFKTAPNSAKDYVHIDDVCRRLLEVSLFGSNRLYNLAAGSNITHAEIASILGSAGVSSSFEQGAVARIFPVVTTSRADLEFGSLDRPFSMTFGEVLKSSLETTREANI